MKQFVWAVVLGIVSLGACARSDPSRTFEPARGEIVAQVNGVAITKAELDLWAGRGRHGEAAADEGRQAKALETLVDRELVRQEAYKQGLHEQASVAPKLDALRAQYLAAQRDELAAAYNAHELATSPAVGEAETRTYFEQHAAALRTEVHIMQIAYSRDPNAIVEAKRALDKGEPFEAVASRRFTGLPADQKPWDLGYLRFTQLPAEWRDVVAKLEPGQASDVLKGAGERWWIIFVADKRVNDAITFESERQVIATLLQNEQIEKRRAERHAALRQGAEITFAKP